MTTDDLHTHTRVGAEGEHIVTVTGQVDLATAEAFQQALDHAVIGRKRLTVDLADLGFLDSAGIKVLFDLAARVDLHVIVNPDSIVSTTLKICGLEETTTIGDR